MLINLPEDLVSCYIVLLSPQFRKFYLHAENGDEFATRWQKYRERTARADLRA